MMKRLIYLTMLLLAVLPRLSAHADIDSMKVNITNNFEQQIQAFPQEKIHLHIDKPTYLSGERIWFKAHVVNSSVHIPMEVSHYVYVELIDPPQRVIERVKVRQEDGYSGHIDMPEELPEGNYSVRAYTYYMQNMSEKYYPTTSIYVSDPSASKFNIEPTFEHEKKNKVNVSLAITELEKKQLYTPQALKISFNDEPVTYKMKDNHVTFSVKLHKDSTAHVLLVECDKYKKNIAIPNLVSDYDLSFYPEGGNFIADAVNQLAFKAVDNNGMPIEVKGTIVDENEKKISAFHVLHEGMGSVIIKPENNKILCHLLLYGNDKEI